MKKIRKFLLLLIVFTFAVNLIIGLISTYLPVKIEKGDLVSGPMTYFAFNLGAITVNINQTIVSTWVLMALLIFIVVRGTRRLSIQKPGKIQLVLEAIYKFIDGNFMAGLSKYKEMFIPFFASMFCFLLLSNLAGFLFPYIPTFTKNANGVLGVVPFFRNPTADMNTTVGLAIVVFIIMVLGEIKRDGLGTYLKKYAKITMPIDVLSELSKPVNISMRLFGNLFAGLIIGSLMLGLMSSNLTSILTFGLLKGPFSFSLGWPAGLSLYFDLFVGVIQAYVFTTLSSVYIGQALSED